MEMTMPTTQPDFFRVTYTPGQRERDRVLKRFDGSEWQDYIVSIIERISDTPLGITADEVRAAMDSEPMEPNVIGSAFRVACLRGIIEPIGYRQSSRKESHARVLRVWRRVRR